MNTGGMRGAMSCSPACSPGKTGLVGPPALNRPPPARGVHAVDWTVLREIRETLIQRCTTTTVDPDGEDPSVSAQELTECWLEVAAAEQKRQGCGALTDRDKEFIAVRVSQSMREVDPKCTNLVDKDEWVHHMLLTRSSPITMKAMMQINTLLDVALDQCPGILVGLQHAFEVAEQAVLESRRIGNADEPLSEPGGHCKLPVRQILNVFARKLWHLRPADTPMTKPSLGTITGSTDDFVNDAIRAMDLDSCVNITYGDFLALCLGRKERPVILHFYDLSKGAASALSPWLLSEHLQGVWHTGVVIFGREYYFGGDIYYDTPANNGFGSPSRVLFLGYTLRQREELHAFVVDELKAVFSREAYDAVNNNCNHFTDRLAMYLVGKHIPEEVLNQPQLMMNTSLGRTLRPILNRWLGLCFEPHSTAAEVSHIGGMDKNLRIVASEAKEDENEVDTVVTLITL